MRRKRIFKIGARSSPLALKQIEEIIPLLKKVHPEFVFNLVRIDTAGDKDKVTPLEKLEGTDFFTREIEQALLREKIDLAVHSAKDMPDVLPEGLEIAVILKSIDPYDVLVSKGNLKLDELPSGAKIGTSSLRRKIQLKSFRRDFQIVDIRGNIEERLSKLNESDLDAIVLAAAGLIRLSLEHRITQKLSFDILCPHSLQGCLAIEIRSSDTKMKSLISRLPRSCMQSEV
ncbi:MAG: hydroxymethylbilane synthase [Candidatus Omnitrophica bacterium]|nr:hydroxymethylbilane synthase [Candidatus Omnitrophota bacterium]